MFKAVIISMGCIVAMVAAGGSCGGCPEGKVCCFSDNVSYKGKCYDNTTQTCCQTWDSPNICNKTTQHCTNDNQGCHAGPPIPPVCNKTSIGECHVGQACCYATHGSYPLPGDIPPPKCFWTANETCCVSQVNPYQTPVVSVCNSTQKCDTHNGCKNL
eukprot:TRINITY_DN8863_c0_g1_i2.p1 TRINITY_DN8863_c0_g1~~TRINITY_DN8863_c0_g1_i2.p1  ORF type:complete len:179 (+),score=31.33 TRINITY_DN8863_c0_g1_i2:65-538(+)